MLNISAPRGVRRAGARQSVLRSRVSSLVLLGLMSGQAGAPLRRQVHMGEGIARRDAYRLLSP